MADDSLAKRSILITGASSGIGRATAIALAARGAQLREESREWAGLPRLTPAAGT